MAKSKDDVILAHGRIIDASPGAKFKVELDSGHTLNAVISGKIRKNNIRIILDDEVDVELSVYDLSLGRIVYRYGDSKWKDQRVDSIINNIQKKQKANNGKRFL